MTLHLVQLNFKNGSTPGVKPHEDGIVKKGTIMDFDPEAGETKVLVSEGILREIPGASTEDEAREILAKEAADAAPALNIKDSSSRTGGENTWGAKKDEVKTDAQAPAKTAPAPTNETAPGSGVPLVGGGDVAPTKDESAEL